MAKKTEVMRLRLEEALRRKALKQAQKEQRTLASLVRIALVRYLEETCESAQS